MKFEVPVHRYRLAPANSHILPGEPEGFARLEESASDRWKHRLAPIVGIVDRERALDELPFRCQPHTASISVSLMPP